MRIFNSFKQKFDKYQKTLTFAQANVYETPTIISDKIVERASATLLVISNDDKFSDWLIEYAIGMAKRFSYNILALSSIDLRLPVDSIVLRMEFKRLALENSLGFKLAADELSIPFTHVVTYHGVGDAIKELSELHDITLVVSETLEDRDVSSKGQRMEERLFTYTLT